MWIIKLISQKTQSLSTVSRIKSKNLYELIKSLNKNEKRYFKIATASSQEADDKKMHLLFDAINKQEEFDEEKILEKCTTIKREQLSNIKAYLYQRVLQTMRQYNASKIPEIEIREQIDFAQLLFNRRLFNQGMDCLKSAKKVAQEYDHLELQLEIIKLEKSVLMNTIDHDNMSKVDRIISEVRQINAQINNINSFSNLAIKLNSLYTKTGYIKDEDDFYRVKEFFYTNLPYFKETDLSITEKIYLYRLHIGYNFYIQDFENGFIYSKKLLETFESSDALLKTDTESYIRALNSLLAAQYKLNRYKDFIFTFEKLKEIGQNPQLEINENLRIMLLKYNLIHEINRYFLLGDFENGVKTLLDNPQSEIYSLILLLDKHSTLIFYYKIASLYVGAGMYSQAVKWLNNIINIPNADIREDLHCFARMLNLICHYELGNFDVINYYIRSTYRFLFKKDDLHQFQKYILGFLRTLTRIPSNDELRDKFVKLKAQLIPLTQSRYEKRAFVYFDIISWLESKEQKKPVEEIIKQKSIAWLG